MFPLATKFGLGEARRQYIDTQLQVNCVSASKLLKDNDIQAGINNWRYRANATCALARSTGSWRSGVSA
jgi:hypothetical protein